MVATPTNDRKEKQQKLRELVNSMSNGYGFLDRQFLAETKNDLCILEVTIKPVKTGKQAGQEKWWILAVAMNKEGVNETGYLTFDRSTMRDRFFSALKDDNLLPVHNLHIEKVDIQNGMSYYDVKMKEEDNETCPCTPHSTVSEQLLSLELEDHPF